MIVGLIENRGGLDHFDHEGGTAPRQIVGGADTTEKLADHADMGIARGHEGPGLRQHGDQRVLAQEGRFAGHVGPGQQPDRGRLGGGQIAVIGDESLCPALQRMFHHRVPAALDPKGAAAIDAGTHPALACRDIGEGAGKVDLGQRARRLPDPRRMIQHRGAKPIEDAALDFQRAVAGVEDARLQFRKLDRGKADLVGGGLTVDEGVRHRQHPVGMGGGGLDEISQHVVVPDLQALHPGPGGVIGLHPGDHAAPLVAQAAGLVQIGVVTGRDETAIATQQRRLGHQCLFQKMDQIVMSGQIACGVAQDRRDIAGQPRGDPGTLGQAGTDRGQIARSAPVQRQTGQGAVHVGHTGQCLAQIGREARIIDHLRHRVVPRMDQRQIAAGGADAAFQQPRPRRRDGSVDGSQQRSLAPARQGLGQFQIAPGRGVDLHRGAVAFARRRAQQRQPAFLRHLQILDDRPHRRQFRAPEGAESVQRLDPVKRAEPTSTRAAVEGAGVTIGQGGARFRRQIAEARTFAGQNFTRRKPGQFGSEARQRTFHYLKRAGRDIDPGQCAVLAYGREGGQEIVAPCLQQRFLGQGTGRDQPHHVAGNDRLGPPFPGLGRIFHLFGDGDAEPLADQRQQIAFGGMDRHPAHRDGLALMGAAFRQRDVQGGGGGHGVVEEHLVEIAHAIEQKRAGIGVPDRQILRHHRCGLIAHAGPSSVLAGGSIRLRRAVEPLHSDPPRGAIPAETRRADPLNLIRLTPAEGR